MSLWTPTPSLSSSARVLGSMAKVMAGSGSVTDGILDGRGLVAQGVAGEGFLELGDGADVSGGELGDGDELLAQDGGDVGELFSRAAGVVGDRGVVLEHAADDLEVGDASGEGIADGLEDEERERRGGGDGARGRLGIRRGGDAGDGFALGGRGDVVDHEVEDFVAADVAQAGGEQDGEELVFADGVVDAGDDVLLADGSGVEELAHELVIAFGDEFDEGLVRGLGLLGHVGGDVFDAGAAVAADLVVVGLHLDQIDDALEGFFRLRWGAGRGRRCVRRWR